MLPTSLSAERPSSAAGLDAEQAAQHASSSASKSISTIASTSPTTGNTTPVTSSPGIAHRVDGVGRAAARARCGTDTSIARPIIPDSAVAGGAGADVGQLAQRVELRSRVAAHCSCPLSRRRRRVGASRRRARRSTARRSRRSGRSRPSASTAPPETAVLSPTCAGSGRVTSSRWPTSRSTASAIGPRGPRTTTAKRAVAAASPSDAAPRRAAAARRSRRTSICRPAAERTGGRRARACVSTRSSGMASGRSAGLDQQGVDDRQGQRQPDLGGGTPTGLGVQRDVAAEPADRGAHGVHADAAAGDVARLRRRSRTRARRAARWRAPCRSRRPARR